MPNINTAKFTLAYGDVSRSLGDRLQDQRITVLDFGADPTGETDSTTAIQDAFDFAFGPREDPHGGPPGTVGVNPDDDPSPWHSNKPVHFPAGDYKVSSTLKMFAVFGGVVTGAGSHQTRIFWDGAEHLPSDSGGISSLLEVRNCWYFHMEGITIDASGVQDVAMRSMHFGEEQVTLNSGSGAYYRDVHLTGGPGAGFLTNADYFGSERTWINCRFTNNGRGVSLVSANAVNHIFNSCHFADNEIGIKSDVGGAATLFACRFENHEFADVNLKQTVFRLVGCRALSKNFAAADGVIWSCVHIHDAAEGFFWSPSDFPGLGPTEWVPDNTHPNAPKGTDLGFASIKGNYSSNGILHCLGGYYVHLVGNTFDNADYLDYTTAIPSLWENGVELNP